LLTSYGLRSLAAGEPDYKPHYTGDPWHRDGAYHQGTVWAWLLGHYALGEYRVHGDADLGLQRLGAMRDHLFDAGLGTVSEIFEAEPPHFPEWCALPGLVRRLRDRGVVAIATRTRIETLTDGSFARGWPQPSLRKLIE